MPDQPGEVLSEMGESLGGLCASARSTDHRDIRIRAYTALIRIGLLLRLCLSATQFYSTDEFDYKALGL